MKIEDSSADGRKKSRRFHPRRLNLVLLFGSLLCGIPVFGYTGFTSGITVVRQFTKILKGESDIPVGLDVMDLCAPLIFTLGSLLLVLMTTRLLLVVYHLFSTCLIVLPDGIEIRCRNEGCFVSQDDLLHILRYEAGMTLVWNLDGSLRTFFIKDVIFGSKCVDEIAGFLKEYSCYTKDERTAKEICKKLKLNHISRRTRYEFQLGKLAKSRKHEAGQKL